MNKIESSNRRIMVSRGMKINTGNYTSVDLFASSSFDLEPDADQDQRLNAIFAEHRLLASALLAEKLSILTPERHNE